MENLIAICGVSFLVVFAELGALALIMVAITSLFPAKEAPAAPKKSSRPGTRTADPAVLAAVEVTVHTLIPGARVVRMEEDR